MTGHGGNYFYRPFSGNRSLPNNGGTLSRKDQEQYVKVRRKDLGRRHRLEIYTRTRFSPWLGKKENRRCRTSIEIYICQLGICCVQTGRSEVNLRLKPTSKRRVETKRTLLLWLGRRRSRGSDELYFYCSYFRKLLLCEGRLLIIYIQEKEY